MLRDYHDDEYDALAANSNQNLLSKGLDPNSSDILEGNKQQLLQISRSSLGRDLW